VYLSAREEGKEQAFSVDRHPDAVARTGALVVGPAVMLVVCLGVRLGLRALDRDRWVTALNRPALGVFPEPHLGRSPTGAGKQSRLALAKPPAVPEAAVRQPKAEAQLVSAG